MLPEFNLEGDLPAGVHFSGWQEFQERFSVATARRTWLSGRLTALLELVSSTGTLRRVFVWGSFVTTKPAPKDLDILLIMGADFEVDQIPDPARIVFDSSQAKLRFETDVFWAKESIGEATLQLWLETYQTSRTFRKRGIVELVLP